MGVLRLVGPGMTNPNIDIASREELLREDPAATETMLAQLKADATDALENLRDLARGIYPPLLADKGLATALESQARKSVVPVSLESDGIARYPQEVEAAVYFCCLEALQNVAKYAGASEATIRLTDSAGMLVFEVIDDGTGVRSGGDRLRHGVARDGGPPRRPGRAPRGAKRAGPRHNRRGETNQLATLEVG